MSGFKNRTSISVVYLFNYFSMAKHVQNSGLRVLENYKQSYNCVFFLSTKDSTNTQQESFLDIFVRLVRRTILKGPIFVSYHQKTPCLVHMG